MSKLKTFTWTTALLLCLAAVGLADDEGAFLTGSAKVGGHYYDKEDAVGRVGEYVSQDDLEELLPHAKMYANGGTPATLYNIMLLYKNGNTNGFGLDLNTNRYLSAEVNYKAFVHNLDHDLLQNLQAREAVSDGAGGFQPGGKQVYYTDNDPTGRYSIRYKKFTSDVAMELPFVAQGKAYSHFSDQRRMGWKQNNTIDHCAFCHIEGHARAVNNRIKVWKAGVEGATGPVTWNYEFRGTEYRDHTKTPLHRWKDAYHPVYGDIGPHPSGNPEFPYWAEFGSRLTYEDVTLPYSRPATSEKRSHHVRLKLDVNDKHALKGSLQSTERENTYTNVEGDFNAYAASWTAKPSRSFRLQARFLAYESKVDNVFVNLPNYRDGRPGMSGQDFDWTRISAANRDVWQVDLGGAYRCSKGGYLKASWRHKVIDREAMAQSQTTYVNNEGVNVMIPSTPYANETTIDRINLSLSKRFGMKGNGRLSYTYTAVDMPFMNPTAMCEPGLNGTDHTLAGNGSVYYFQRQRIGNGTNQPSASHRISMRGSYQLTSRTSVNGYLNYTDEKNDELNIYEYDRSVLSPGATLWTAPSDKLMLTLGYSFSKIESNANLCPPIFDG